VKVFPDASVDLEYLDPPFNSNANYNVLFKETSGADSQAQFHAFTDTWEWTADVDATYHQFIDTCPNASVVELVEALKKFLKTSPMMAYLADDGLPRHDGPAPRRTPPGLEADRLALPPLRPHRLCLSELE
jgi:hypothetical protein